MLLVDQAKFTAIFNLDSLELRKLPEKNMKNQKGFSLIELLIVVVIIGIIAAIAIPNLLAARRSANEGSAISSLRTLHGAEVTYASSTGAGNYATLSLLSSANLVDNVLGCATEPCVKSGYKFTSGKTDAATGTSAVYGAKATPVTTAGVTQTGTRDFGVATEGVIYSGSAGALTLTGPTLSGTSSPLQ